MEIGKCAWCGTEAPLQEHHYPVAKSEGGTDTIKICLNCHYKWHNIGKTLHMSGNVIKHLERFYCINYYNLIKLCEDDELRFYSYLKLYAINHSSAFPSLKTICEDLRKGKPSIVNTIKKMENKGRLVIIRDRIKRRANIYDITWYDEQNVPIKNGEKVGGTKTILGGTKTVPPYGRGVVQNQYPNNKELEINNNEIIFENSKTDEQLRSTAKELDSLREKLKTSGIL